MDFEWDSAKTREDLEKRGVFFEVAAKVFRDPASPVDRSSLLWQRSGRAGVTRIVPRTSSTKFLCWIHSRT
jgi:uncharacterized DUF497 family protein